jgi:hypothetical protein
MTTMKETLRGLVDSCGARGALLLLQQAVQGQLADYLETGPSGVAPAAEVARLLAALDEAVAAAEALEDATA